MPLYMYQAAYTAESLAAQLKKPENRVEGVGRSACEAVGGKLVGGWYCFGDYDLDFRFCYLERLDIGRDQCRHFSRSIDKDNFHRAARQRFDSDRARSRTQVKKSRALDSRREDVEERLAQPIRGWSRLDRWRAF